MAKPQTNIRYDNAKLKITEKGDGFLRLRRFSCPFHFLVGYLRADVTMVEAGVLPTSDTVVESEKGMSCHKKGTTTPLYVCRRFDCDGSKTASCLPLVPHYLT